MFVNCSLSCYFLCDLLFSHLVSRNPHLYFFVFVQTLQLSVGFGFHLPREPECWELATGKDGCFLQLFGNLLPTLAGLEAEGAFRQLPLLLLDTGLTLCLPPLPALQLNLTQLNSGGEKVSTSACPLCLALRLFSVKFNSTQTRQGKKRPQTLPNLNSTQEEKSSQS